MSEWELFHTLTSSATLLVCPDTMLQKPRLFAEAIAPCALLFLVPSHLSMLLHALRDVKAQCRIRHVICCGEALPPATVTAFYDMIASRAETTQLHNVYGPTEASMTHHTCVAGEAEVLIGKPIDNTTVRIHHTPVNAARRRRLADASVRSQRLHPPLSGKHARACVLRCGSSTHRAGWCLSARRARFALVASSPQATSRSQH